jgi:MraZ protein
MPDAQNIARFIGKELYTLDDKGRVTIPKKWRLKGEKSDTWFVVPESLGRCLRLLPAEAFFEFVAKSEKKLEDDPVELRMFRSNFVGEAAEVEADKQGRIPIPKEKCQALDLSGEVWMRGAGDLIEIWNKQRLDEHQQADRPQYLQVAAKIGA